MALSDSEKSQVIDSLDKLDEVARRLILASLDAFTEWLSNVLYSIFLKVRNALASLWNWICSQF